MALAKGPSLPEVFVAGYACGGRDSSGARGRGVLHACALLRGPLSCSSLTFDLSICSNQLFHTGKAFQLSDPRERGWIQAGATYSTDPQWTRHGRTHGVVGYTTT